MFYYSRVTLRSRILLTGVLVVAGTGLVSLAAEPTNQDLLDEVRRLQARVGELEAAQKSIAATTQQSSADQDLHQALAASEQDADRRSNFLDVPGFTAGYTGERFVIRSDDGRFLLSPGVAFQFRWVLNDRQDFKPDGNADTQTGFEVRRLKFKFEGNAFSPDFTYKFQWNTNRKTGVPELDEAWVNYHFHDTPWGVRAGQITNGWDRESAVSFSNQLAVERSYLEQVYAGGGTGTDDYVQGVQLTYSRASDPLSGWIMYHDGINSRNTNFQDGGGGAPLLGIVNTQWGVAARAEFKLAGDWRSYRDFTALNNKQDLLVIGLGGDAEGASNVNAYFHTADVQWKPAAVPGFSLFAAYVGLLRDFRKAPAGEGSPYDWGAIVQASYLLNPHLEVFGRYDYTNLDLASPPTKGTIDAAARVENHIPEITAGLNYYFHGQAAKLSLDAVYLPNGSPINLDGAGILAQTNHADQFVLRAQFQLLL